MPAGMPPAVQVQVSPPAKPWWASRTLIVNAIALALAAAESQLQLLQAVLPVNVYALLAFVLPVLNAGLRLVTTTAVQLRAPDTTAISPSPGWPDLPPVDPQPPTSIDAPQHNPQDKT
jgi:hypothetical protein